MNERPMRQISLRAFRDSVATIHHPVEVSRRDGEGNIQVLGYWTPYVQFTDETKPIEPAEPGEPSTVTFKVLDAEGKTVVEPRTFEIPVPDEEPDGPRVIHTPAEAAVAAPVHPVRAVPKPSQRKRR